MNGIKSRWMDDDRTIIMYEVFDGWTWEALTAEVNYRITEYNQLSHQINVIINFSHTSEIPRGVIHKGKELMANIPAHVSRDFAIVGTNNIIRSVLNLFSSTAGKLLGISIRFVATVDEALEYFDEQRAGV